MRHLFCKRFTVGGKQKVLAVAVQFQTTEPGGEIIDSHQDVFGNRIF